MSMFGSVNEVLDFAIAREEEAAKFYKELSGISGHPGMGKLFEQFAREEEGHKAKLLSVKAGKKMAPAEQKLRDLKISDYLVDVEPGGDLDYQQALILAMKKEKLAFRLYTNLSDAVEDEGLRTTFLLLAQEEAKHKLRFEIEYDDHVMTEN